MQTASFARNLPRRPAFAFFCAYALFVLYATLLPFQFTLDPAALQAKRAWINWNPTQLVTGEPTPLTDVVSNIAFFVPLGVIGLHAQRRRGHAATIARAAGAGVLLSAGVETLQFFTPTRNPATSDVLTNGFGTLLGALVAAFFQQHQGAMHQRVLAWMRREPLLPVCMGFALVVILGALIPFDFTFAVSSLKRAVRAARFDPWNDPSPWRSSLAVALQYAVLAGLAWQASTRMRWGNAAARIMACGVGFCLLGIGLEVAQLAVRSRTTSARDALAATAGVFMGLVVAAGLGTGRRARSGWWLVGTAYAGCIVLLALQPFEFDFRWQSLRDRVSYTSLIPYSSYYYKANVAAVADFLEGLLSYLPLAFVLAHAHTRRGNPPARLAPAVALGCMLLALVLEVLQLGMPRRYSEVSDVLTAGLGGALGASAWRWVAHLSGLAAAAPETPATTPPAERWVMALAEDETSGVPMVRRS
jgi:glycopeptide antibiotics resistance protein